jgi:hypothetical protein
MSAGRDNIDKLDPDAAELADASRNVELVELALRSRPATP